MKERKWTVYRVLFGTFFKASAFTFGGGLAIITVIERDMVVRHHLMTKDEFMEYATLSQSMPGVIALNCATLVGRHAAGTGGMLAAGIGAILPTLVLMVLATVLAELIPQQGPLMGAMRGIRAASAALVVSAAASLGGYNIRSLFAVILMVVAFVLSLTDIASAPAVIVLSGLTGIAYQAARRALKRRKSRAS